MSQWLIQPGLSAAGRYHPRTALPIEPLGEVNGKLIWPVIGGDEADDPDDPRFQDGGGASDEDDEEDEDDEDDDQDDEDDKPKSKKKSKDDDEDDDKPKYTEDEMHAVKRRMRKADQRASKAEERIRQLEAQLAKKPKSKGTEDEDTASGVDNEELRKLRERNAQLEKERRQTKLEKEFSRVPLPEGEEWVDMEDAVAAAQRLGLLDDVLDEDGTVDRRSLRAALRELKRRKPHLVRKVSDPDEDEDDDTEEGQRPKIRKTASKMNGKRKGKSNAPDKSELAKRFPVLGR